jgi:hypothetical protein
VESVGIVLHESDESITVAGHWNHGDPDNDEEIASVSGDMTIPKCSIVSMKTLACEL